LPDVSPVEPDETSPEPADRTKERPTGWPLPTAEPPEERRRRRALWALAVVFLGVQLVAVYLPGSPDGGLELPWLPGADKVVHFLIFAIPVYLFGRLSGRVGLVAGLFAVHAVVSELVQWRFIPYRDGDVWDAVADLLGIGAAALAVLHTKPTSWR
jgi:VanZ family protein